MSSQLDPAILAAITAEARQCFLDEDAPEYLEMLRSGIEDRANPDFNALLRAAHSLKGGAGLACLTSLQKLSHKLEDVLVGLQQSQIAEIELAWALVENSIDEIGFVVSQAHNVEDAIANPELIIALESLVAGNDDFEAAESGGQEVSTNNNDFIRHTLTGELASSFEAIEELESDTEADLLEQFLAAFADECGFLAETLDLPWLGSAVAPIGEAIKLDPRSALLLTKEIIAQLRQQITEYLEQSAANLASLATATPEQDVNQSLIATTLNEDLEELCQAIADLEMDTPEEIVKEAITGFADECTFLSETLELPWLVEAISPIQGLLTEWDDPFEALLTVQGLVGEIRQQRELYLADHLASAASDEPEAFISSVGSQDQQALNSDTGFFDFGEHDEDASPTTVMFAPPAAAQDKMIEKVAKVAEIQKSAPTSNNQVKISLERLQGMTNNVEELILSQSRISRQQRVLNQANRRLRSLTRQFEPIREQIQDLYNQLSVESSGNPYQNASNHETSFDSLEMDHYTDLHSSLQSFQELMLQIQETRTDIDFIDRELTEDLEHSEKNLNTLYSQVTDSRLVPFETLAKRFIPQIRGLSQRFDKLVDLKIEGKNTLVDQILLEQLQTPLTHLLNNAFDHGIESKYERLATNKAETATIALNAKLQNNQLVITIKDDGGGINPEKVFQRALQRGICPPEKSISDFRPEEIVNWIFEPDFSTAAQVSDISGRGMGLDIVLNLIRQLRGQLFVATDVGFGSTFTISLPLNLSLQSLMLIQLQNRLIAIPHTSILEILPYRELEFTDEGKENLNWQGKTIALTSIASLFPCPRKPLQLAQGQVCVVLETSFEPLAILVDAIAGEEKSIVKPFDETIPVPTYIVGCTILGTGEVIPVIMPQGIAKDVLAPGSVTGGVAAMAQAAAQTISTVLIAEDSVATRRMLEKVLLAAGYQVLVCRDGQEALDQIAQYPGRIDLILSDIEMPRVNGFELLEKVRAQPAFENIPIVMATSRTGDRHRQEAERLGATDYLGKPVQPQELIDTVANLLAKK
jgi:chemotaxis protein histidine kinase CheA/ActR/RegA family two-component response regulator